MNPGPPFRPRNPHLVPVLDVMGGRVVRAVGGQRSEYRPLRSQLTVSTAPIEVAAALLAAAGATALYVADLDAIGGGSGVSASVDALLKALDCRVWVDIGVTAIDDISTLPARANICPVVGFETASGPECLRASCFAAGRGPTALSIDLRDGELIGNWRAWDLDGPRDTAKLARRAVDFGIGALIVLDLARVGMGDGCGTERICAQIRAEFPDVELIAGGGIRNWDDVDHLAAAGADAVLVASALHDGSLTIPRGA